MTRSFLLAVGILIGLLISVSWLTLSGRLTGFDHAVIQTIYTWRSPGLTSAMIGISALGNQAIYLASAGIIAYLVSRKQWSNLGYYVVLILGQEIVNRGFKGLIARPRPDYLPLMQEASYSFPSGHSMAAVVFYGALAVWMQQRGYGSRYFPWIWFASAGVIALLIGLSRIYLGVHYPTDVLAGFLTGGIWLLLLLSLSPYREHRSEFGRE